MFPAKFLETVEVILFIAMHSGDSLVRSKEIAEQKKLPLRHFEPILQLLVKEKILKGAKGPKGGYCLAREKRKITLGEVYSILLKQHEWDNSSLISKNIITPLMQEYTQMTQEKLEGTTIDALCKEYNLMDQNKEKINFSI